MGGLAVLPIATLHHFCQFAVDESLEGRTARWDSGHANVHVHIKLIAQEGSPANQSWYRSLSAEYIYQSIMELLSHLDASKILVLTPFREQRKFLRDRLSVLDIQGIDVSTVHRAQGSQRHTVFFDPVRGASYFLRNNNGGAELINVALSRAMAKLVITVSNGDRQNEILDWIAQAYTHQPAPKVETSAVVGTGAIALADIVSAPDFPAGYVGKHVKAILEPPTATFF
jgi:DNA replication ATP-dependent helicase Dna2